MQYLYPFIISFIFIFFSELGDKTQILVLSFSTKKRSSHILFGVALGTFLSHGLAIAFGSHISIIGNDNFIYYLKFLTYCTFLIFGIIGFIKLIISSSTNNSLDTELNSGSGAKSKIIIFLNSITRNCVLLVATSIVVGELGDKTFLASLGLGVQYPQFKFPLICGSIFGMVASNSIALFFGKWLGSKISPFAVEILSNIIFILFGVIGIFSIICTK